jgi:hypothetical protein
VGRLARILGCGVSKLPIKYLRLPLGASFKVKYILDDVIEKLEYQLAIWKRCTCLSKGGKVILIKSTLTNLPMYYMSPFAFLASVAKCIEKIQHDIFWGWLGEEFKYHRVSWSKFCFSISKGGLGINNLLVFNRALFGKWLWRYGCGREAWLRVVVDSKFGSLLGEWCSLVLGGAFGGGGRGRISRKGEISFSALLDLRWGIHRDQLLA